MKGLNYTDIINFLVSWKEICEYFSWGSVFFAAHVLIYEGGEAYQE